MFLDVLQSFRAKCQDERLFLFLNGYFCCLIVSWRVLAVARNTGVMRGRGWDFYADDVRVGYIVLVVFIVFFF